MAVVKDVIDSILHDDPILEWNHNEICKVNIIGQKLIGKIPNFDGLKPLRGYIKQFCKRIPILNFVDDSITTFI